MTRTEYLFGHPKEKYKGLTELATERLKDAETVKRKLYNRRKYEPNKQNKFQFWLKERILKVEDAIKTWKKILELEID